MGWDGLNLVATLGALTIAVSVLLFIVNVVAQPAPRRARRRQSVGRGTLEWVDRVARRRACNFDAIPVVHGRDPLWEPAADAGSASAASRPTAARCCDDASLDAEPETRAVVPGADHLAVR